MPSLASPKAAIGVASLAESFVSLVGLVTYFFVAGPINWKLGLALLVGAIAPTPLSTRSRLQRAQSRSIGRLDDRARVLRLAVRNHVRRSPSR